MFNFCTLFDSNYISRGLALFESLKKTTPDFHLYVIAFDEDCYQFLKKNPETGLTVISLAAFEDEKLKQVKPTRTAAEYCWTCTPSVILYCIEKFNLPSCTYVDADMIFYDNPGILLKEMRDESILITEHRYTKDYDVSDTHGIFCVQFMYFKNDENGMKALVWWRDRCLEWCYAYLEDGKFGDQKYLDDWTERFQGVHVLQYPGGALAPWNIQQYGVDSSNGQLFITEIKTSLRYPIIFYHFHGLRFFSDEKVACCAALYQLNGEVKDLIYFPYIRRLIEIGNQVRKSGFERDPQGARHPAPTSWRTLLEYGKNVIFLIVKKKLPLFKKTVFSIRLHDHIYRLDDIK